MRKFLLIGALLSVCLLSHAQRTVSFPFFAYDEDASILVGINYSYINSKYIVGLKDDALDKPLFIANNNSANRNQLTAIHSSHSHGVSVGIPIDFRITDHWYASFYPNYTFINNTGITYYSDEVASDDQLTLKTWRVRSEKRDEDGKNKDKSGNFDSFEFPVRLRLRSEEKHFLNRQNRYRGYITAGAKLTRWLNITEKYADDPDITWIHPIIMKPEYGSWEVGVGTEIFFPYFKLSPEIRFSQSFGNILDHNNKWGRYDHRTGEGNPFMGKLDRVLARGIYFSLIFQ